MARILLCHAVGFQAKSRQERRTWYAGLSPADLVFDGLARETFV